jgi:hypothetical protein
LRQAAGLEPRWNEDCIGAGLDQMGQVFVVTKDASDLPSVIMGERSEPPLQLRIA